VDDASVNLKLTDILLRKEGHKVHTVPDAEEALRVLRNFRSDVMLVDFQLPGMNGLELTKRVKQDPRTGDIIVIALTACAMKEDEARPECCFPLAACLSRVAFGAESPAGLPGCLNLVRSLTSGSDALDRFGRLTHGGPQIAAA
jgi:CheY-like chemotaxis protein